VANTGGIGNVPRPGKVCTGGAVDSGALDLGAMRSGAFMLVSWFAASLPLLIRLGSATHDERRPDPAFSANLARVAIDDPRDGASVRPDDRAAMVTVRTA
jgi:hypothetical protein